MLAVRYTAAGAQAREGLAASVAPDAASWLRGMMAHAGLHEAFVLATCQRLEFFAATPRPADALTTLRDLVRRGADVVLSGDDAHAAVGLDVATHLARTAAGLNSMVLGEAEIAGQVRRAAHQARKPGGLGPHLETLVSGALRASGRVRAETTLARGAMSVAGTAVAYGERALGGLTGRNVLIVGAGCVGREAAARAASRRPASVTVVSRSRSHAAEAATRARASAAPFDALANVLEAADLVIVASGRAAEWLVSAGLVARAMGRRRLAADKTRRAPMTLVDISVPRAVAPEAGSIDDVTLATIDDLGEVAAAAAAARRRAIPAAEAIVRIEARHAYARFRRRADRGLAGAA
jgi:glutamyl-tRNA reductase